METRECGPHPLRTQGIEPRSRQKARLAQGVENHWLWGHTRCSVIDASTGGEVRAGARFGVDVQPANLDGGAAEEAVFFNLRRRGHGDALDGHLQRKLRQHLPQTRDRALNIPSSAGLEDDDFGGGVFGSHRGLRMRTRAGQDGECTDSNEFPDVHRWNTSHWRGEPVSEKTHLHLFKKCSKKL